jgi:cytochrome c oxidase subunit 2
MAARRHVARWGWSLLPLVALVLLVLLCLAGCRPDEFPQTTLTPHSNYADAIQSLLEKLVFWVVVIFVVVQSLLIYTVVRFRSRPGAPDPKPVHGNTALEVGWTVAPAIILALIAVPTVLTIYQTQGRVPAGALEVTAVGHQWWWEFKYPGLGITTADEMHVPNGRPVNVTIESADVVHSFWFPAIGGKRDAIPEHHNHMWFTPDRVGTFPGQCAELCGISHANMRMKLMVEEPAAFDAWVARQQAPPAAPESTSVAWRGKQVFTQSACIACHTINGVSAGVIGPNLTHVGGRTTIAGALFENNAENLGRWIEDPPGRKPGSLMPKLNLPPDQVAALVAYLQSLK